MTVYRTATPDSWEGPEWTGPDWAAPERAERWLHKTRKRTFAAPDWGLICRMFAEGLIEAEPFRAAVHIKIVTDRLQGES